MSDKRNQQWVLAARPIGEVKASDFEWKETAVPELADGEVRVRSIYLSLDPANRRNLKNVGAFLTANLISRREIHRKQGLPLGADEELVPIFEVPQP